MALCFVQAIFDSMQRKRSWRSYWLVRICLPLICLLMAKAHGHNIPVVKLSCTSSDAFPAVPDPNSVGEVSNWLRAVVHLSQRVTVTTIGRSSHGREILAVVIQGRSEASSVVPTVAIICREHGDEPAPTLAALELILDVAGNTTQKKGDLLRQMCFVIIPIASPDGATAKHRYIQSGKNPNRDWGIFRLPETRCLETYLRKVRPDVLLDCHELLPGDYESHPYIECGRESTKLARRILQEERKDGCPIELGHTATNCPPTLLYRYFSNVYHKPGVMLESALVGDHRLEDRARFHRAAAWGAAQFVVQQAHLARH